MNCLAWGGLSGSGMVPKRELKGHRQGMCQGKDCNLFPSLPSAGRHRRVQHEPAPERLLGHFLGRGAAPRGCDDVPSPPRDAATASSSTKSRRQPPSPCCLPGRGNLGASSVFAQPQPLKSTQLMRLCLIKWLSNYPGVSKHARQTPREPRCRWRCHGCARGTGWICSAPSPKIPGAVPGGGWRPPKASRWILAPHQQPLMGSEPAEQGPRRAPRAGPGKAGLGREGKALEAELLPPGGDGLQEGGDSRPHEVKGAARIVLGGGQPRGGQQSLVLSCISLLP